MTGLWLDLLGYAWELVVAGFLLIVGAAIVLGPGDEYSCAPASDEDQEPDEDDDTGAWDRGHDEWTDREMGVI